MRVGNNQRIQASLLDKLLDDSPSEPNKKERSQGVSLAQLRASVKRDVQNLLNAKMRWHTWPKQYKELDSSLLNYGLPDFSSLSMASPEGRKQLCKQVEDALRRFEPRFVAVQVTTGDEQPEDRVLKLRISALLYADPDPEPITFDSELEPVHMGLKVLD